MGTAMDTIPPVINIPADFIAVQDKWLSILKEKDVAPKALSCGGKNVGKSTFNRYLINSTLQRVKSLCYLDCDVGQTEFNPPGCIALHVIHEPVLGPPFTHQQDPFFMCFFGLVSPAEDPRFYSSCMKKVYSQYESMDPKPPLIINTMGWNKGLGINLLVDTCHITCPDLIIQLESMNQSNNFPAVTPDFLHYSPGWLFNRNAESDEEEHKFKHELIIVDSPVVPNIESQLRFHSRDHRDLTTLGYISRCLRSAQGLQEVQPYCVPWKHIALHTCHLAVPPSQILAAFNASFVALCVTDHSKARHIQDNPELPLHFDKTPVCECLGMGIVAGIDMETHEIYLVCPIDLSHLKRVNTLIRGALNLPDQLLLRQKSDSGLPYVGKHLSMIGSSSVRPRRYMPRKRGESNKHGTDE
ncbi:polynucleotide 5'-hydroxyl-kinase NOL9-like isoform X2 [Liolophura sinensis]